MTSDYLKLLFNSNESLWYADSLYLPTSVGPLAEALELPPRCFVAVNPVAERREDADVQAYRNFLLEFDQGTITEQVTLLQRLKFPYSCLTFSGNKSVHAILCLTESLASAQEYRDLFQLIRVVLRKTDPTTGNPSRVTRVPGAYRSDKGCYQELLDLTQRQTLASVKQWLYGFKEKLTMTLMQRAVIQRVNWRSNPATQPPPLSDILSNLSEGSQAFLETGTVTTTTSRHRMLIFLALELTAAGASLDQIEALLYDAHEKSGIVRPPADEISGILSWLMKL